MCVFLYRADQYRSLQKIWNICMMMEQNNDSYTNKTGPPVPPVLIVQNVEDD